jgi:hypothetical protein
MKIYVVKENFFTMGSNSPLHNGCEIKLITLSKKKALAKLQEVTTQKLKDLESFKLQLATSKEVILSNAKLNEHLGCVSICFRVDTYKCNLFGRKGKEIYE